MSRAARRRIADAVQGAAERWEQDAWRARQAGTASRPGQHVIARCLALIALLAEHPGGLRAVDVAGELGTSRSTAYRDLDAIRTAGVLLEQVEGGGLGGTVRWRLGGR